MADYNPQNKGASDHPIDHDKGSDGEDAEFLDKARKRFARSLSMENTNRIAALEDLKFMNGDQWPSGVRARRKGEDRPCLTVNRCPTFVHQVTNPQRENRPSINVNPVGDKGDIKVAKMYRGLIRAIERQSDADVAYDTGFSSAVSCGFGYWRIISKYETEDSFDQVLGIQRIRNAFSVYPDPSRQEPDGADMQWCFISEMMERDEFEQKYPDADPCSWSEVGVGERYKEWISEKQVRVADYYCVETEMRTLVQLKNGHVGWKDELSDDLKAHIKADPDFVQAQRESPCRKIMYYKLSAKEILEQREWPSSYMPIVEVVGDEIDIEGTVTRSGIIRNAKDSQRMYNYWVTSETEMIALAPKAPYIMEEGQIEGHEKQWKYANVKTMPYLLYKGSNVNGHPAPPPQRQQYAGPPMGIIQAKQGAAQDMMATTGIRFDGTLQERMTDESGVAIKELRQNTDMGAFHYIDNFARALKLTGRILIDMIPRIYDTPRIITILREDDKEEQIEIDPQITNKNGYRKYKNNEGEEVQAFKPGCGRYDITVTIGPNFATKRIESARSLLEFAKVVPNAGAVIADLIAKNMDWPGAEEIATRLAKMLPPGLLEIDDKDMPPQVSAMLNSLKQQLQKAVQEKQQLLVALNDQTADRALAQDKVNKDFEVKVLKIIADGEKQQHDLMNAHLDRMMAAVKGIESVQQPPQPGGAQSAPGVQS